MGERQNTILLLSVDQLKNKTFSIGNYQRGYKWGKKEILELLNDIHSFDSANGIYCLQPLILKPKDNLKGEVHIESGRVEVHCNNEVLDGQQRTTTLFIMLKYLVHQKLLEPVNLFNIDYTTRIRSGEFLKEHLDLIFDINIDSIDSNELQEKDYNNVKAVNSLWKEFAENYTKFNNVDVYHFFIVSCYIKKWIECNLLTEAAKREFIDQLLHNVKLIWYSLDDAKDNQNVIDVFLNNNKGKISLTTSELIKALFILNIKNTEIKSLSELQINQFATEWDQIEKKLQDDGFWYFIQPKIDQYNDGTRIDYLFDLHLQKSKKADKFYAYRYYENLFNKGENISNEWEKVVQLYIKLVDWYDDSFLYHYIGFITVGGIRSLTKIMAESKGKTKEGFKKYLIELIKKEFAKQDKIEDNPLFDIYDLDNLDYKNYYSESRKVLLLHNVLYYTSNMAKHKFPFELFVKEAWSIEHIIPQNPKNITDVEVYKQWYIDLLSYNEDVSYSDIIEELKKYNSIEEIESDKEFKLLLDKIVMEYEDTTHKIDNLLLLDKNTNSALGNKLFKDKRAHILKFDQNGKDDNDKPVFIPVETLNAFNKTFSENINIENWLRSDGENYKRSIANRLVDFLPKTSEM